MPALMAARLVVSETGDILSPKVAPHTTMAATMGSGMFMASPMPISTTPIVPTVPHDVPVDTDIIAHSINPTARNTLGFSQLNP
ncbi:hypothetical protein ALT785_40009 [Alteromonas infernus]